MNKKIFLGIGIVALIFFAGFIIWKANKSHQLSNNIANQLRPIPKETTIILNKSGFNPQVVTLKAGGVVRWKNESGALQTVNSDNYPTNQLHRQLNFGIFNNGSSVTFKFKFPGVYGYHNQFNHNQEGKIIVVK